MDVYTIHMYNRCIADIVKPPMKLQTLYSAIRQSPRSAGTLIAVFVLSAILVLNTFGAFQLLGLAVYDWMVSHSAAGTVQPRVALVTITEEHSAQHVMAFYQLI